ncbi:Na/Pi cotransporter family protein [Pelagimonas varians]|uniref:Na+/Pi-cotransporter n=1 Tax=Pelagimonas varians TaxID=696760 RepID=A0A238L4M5_9RHOB|nr:Na/Pi symporter [Pelagimonas varians]PYG26435.1 Na/Pi-cotransporter [Pelagimonas varians]SMX49938.1 Na+/Pi-cotransporter [Pelagimonas varians]
MTEFSVFEVFVSVAAAVVLFVYALRGFSKDVQEAGGEALRMALSRITSRPLVTFFASAGLTALVQSSSAVSGIAVALVEVGTISFRDSLPVFLGANVGTTSTAWLVALDATMIGPLLIILSVAVSFLPGKASLFGRSILYLGVILLALQLISDAVLPLKENTEVAEWMAYATNPLIAFAIGILATALLQSSSVVVGLSIIAVQQNLIGFHDVLFVIVGTNIGTTSTALISSFSMGTVARRSAIANLIFNVLGVAAFVPIMPWVAEWVETNIASDDMAVAVIHLVFNLCVAIVGFIVLRPLASRLERKNV